MKELNEVHIVDISHDIDKFNATQAAYVFGNAFRHFPEGTIHILGIKAGNEPNERFLAMEVERQIILCPDNGIVNLLMENSSSAVIKEFTQTKKEDALFFVRDILAPMAVQLIKNPGFLIAMPNALNTRQILSYLPTSNANSITGRCIYMDTYGNVITNIRKQFFEECRRERAFNIYLPGTKIKKISSNYDDVPEISPVALFNNSGYLEIAVNKGQAKQLLFPRNFNSHTDFNITIEFTE